MQLARVRSTEAIRGASLDYRHRDGLPVPRAVTSSVTITCRFPLRLSVTARPEHFREAGAATSAGSSATDCVIFCVTGTCTLPRGAEEFFAIASVARPVTFFLRAPALLP